METTAAQVDYDTHSVGGVIRAADHRGSSAERPQFAATGDARTGSNVSPGSTSQFNAMFNVSVFGATPGATAGSGVGTRLTMDGGTINDEMEGGTSMNFSQEVVQEFQISTTNFDASTGIGSIGGDEHHYPIRQQRFSRQRLFLLPRPQHGRLSQAWRATPLFPNPFFQRKNPGFLLGGPIKKDKLFFFFNYEYLNANRGSGRAGGSSFRSRPERHLAGALSLQSDQRRASIITCQLEATTLFVRYSHDGNEGFGPYALNAPARQFQLQLQLVRPKHAWAGPAF